MPAVPDINGEGPKEVYAFYGLAMYSAGLLEHALLNLAFVLHLDQVKVITRDVFEAKLSELEEKTLGVLLVATRSLIQVPQETEVVLRVALKKRNYLAHHFFRRRAEVFCHPQGQGQMMDELRALASNFETAEELVTRIYLPLWKRYGVDEALVERQMDAMSNAINERFGEL